MQEILIAEVGSVHDGSFGNAVKLIELVANCGADAVKFQTHIAEAETLPDAPSPSYFQTETRMEYFRRAGFTPKQWQQLKNKADECKVLFLSSPFSLEAVDLLDSIDMEAYKIPSGEVTNLPLLEKIAALGKPVLLSSGMSNWQELDQAVAVLEKNCELTVLQCSSAYPCLPEQVGLNVLQEIRERYDCAVGYSDHTLGVAASIAAATLGATVIEKHFTFSCDMYGSDAQHSMEPAEFRQLARALREVWTMLQCPVDKDSLAPYGQMKYIFQKSIVAAVDLPSATVLRLEHLAFKKPGTGLPAAMYRELIGKRLNCSITKDQMLEKDHWE